MNTSSVVAISIWSMVTIFGLATIIYGLISFPVLPATGVCVAMIGLVGINIGIRKIQKIKGEFDRHKSVGKQGNLMLGDSKGKTYQIVTNLLYLSNFILFSIFLPKFDGTFGDNFGFIIFAIVVSITTILYAGLILSIFQSLKWIISIGLLTWFPFLLKVFYR